MINVTYNENCISCNDIKVVNQNNKILIYSHSLASPHSSDLHESYYRSQGWDKQYRFHGGWNTYERTEIGVRSTGRKWVIRVFTRTSVDRSASELLTLVLQRAINYANWSSGYRSGTAMHVNVRKDICFPSACIRFELTQPLRGLIYEYNLHLVSIQCSTRNTRMCEPYTCVTSARCSYVRMHLKEILSDVRRLFLIRPLLLFCRDFL